MSPITHYRPLDRGAIHCAPFDQETEHCKASPGTAFPRYTTDIRRVTCSHCLAALQRILDNKQTEIQR